MGGGVKYGFIAQEVQKVLPTIVRPRVNDTDNLSLNYINSVIFTINNINKKNISNLKICFVFPQCFVKINNKLKYMKFHFFKNGKIKSNNFLFPKTFILMNNSFNFLNKFL